MWQTIDLLQKYKGVVCVLRCRPTLYHIDTSVKGVAQIGQGAGLKIYHLKSALLPYTTQRANLHTPWFKV